MGFQLILSASRRGKLIGSRVGRSFGWGLAGGAAAAIVGVAYQIAPARAPWLREALGPTALQFPERGWWLIALAVVAAPLCEEYIFRGLVFGGLRRSVGFAGAALGSAAIFAIVHPLISCAPVFCLALIAAFVYENTGAVLAPVLTHAVYNAMVVAAAFLQSWPTRDSSSSHGAPPHDGGGMKRRRKKAAEHG